METNMKHTISRLSRRGMLAAVLVSMPGMRPLHAAELHTRTVAAWNAYVEATERRITEELSSQDKFLALDFEAKDRAAQDRRELRSGEIPVRRITTVDSQGHKIEVPDGLIHHWRGSVFIPGVTLDEKALFAFLKQRLAAYKIPRHIIFVEALPRNATGKILKTTLRQMTAEHRPV